MGDAPCGATNTETRTKETPIQGHVHGKREKHACSGG